MPIRRTQTHALTLGFLALSLAAPSAAKGPPLTVEVEPNALQRQKDGVLPPMDIEIWGATPETGVYLEVLRDCDGDRVADRQGTDTCQSPVHSWTSPPTDANGRIRTELDFETQTWKLPESVGLWLRASRSPDEAGTLVPFGLVKNACDLWDTMVDTFFGGDCNPGLVQALRRHRGPAGLEDVTFEVRRLTLGTGESVAVPGALGATGVAWADDVTLLVTRAPVVLDVPAVLERDKAAAAVPPGLYRIRTAPDAEPELLWAPEDDTLIPAAPFALPGGRIAFVRQSLVGDPLVDDETAVLLSFWKDGGLEPTVVPLPYRVHQILAASKAGDELLVLTLGVNSSRPVLLHVRLAGGEPSVEVAGYHHALYQAAQRSPDGKTSAIAMDDASGRWGWDLVLVDASSSSTVPATSSPGRWDASSKASSSGSATTRAWTSSRARWAACGCGAAPVRSSTGRARRRPRRRSAANGSWAATWCARTPRAT